MGAAEACRQVHPWGKPGGVGEVRGCPELLHNRGYLRPGTGSRRLERRKGGGEGVEGVGVHGPGGRVGN